MQTWIQRAILQGTNLQVAWCDGLARLTPARPDRNGNRPDFFCVLQSCFLAHACFEPEFWRKLEGKFVWTKIWGKSRSKSGSTKKFLQVSLKLLVQHPPDPCQHFFQFPIWFSQAGIKQAWSGFSLARALEGTRYSPNVTPYDLRCAE